MMKSMTSMSLTLLLATVLPQGALAQALSAKQKVTIVQPLNTQPNKMGQVSDKAISIKQASKFDTKVFEKALGGMNSGGGNARNGKLATPTEVREVIRKVISERLVNSYFNVVEANYLKTQPYTPQPLPPADQVPEEMKRMFQTMARFQELLPQLFGPHHKMDIYDFMRSIKWDVRADKPCNGEKQKENDGGYTLPNIVCLSISRLSKNSHTFDVERRIFSLIAHEIAHLRGLKVEADANVVQDAASFAYDKAGAGLNDQERNFAFQFDNMVRELEEAQVHLKNGDSFERVCTDLQRRTNPFSTYLALNILAGSPVSPIRARDYLKFQAVVWEGAMILPSGFCDKAASAALRTEVFGNKDEAKLLDILIYQNSGSVAFSGLSLMPYVSIYPGESMRLISYGDTAALSAELKRLYKRLLSIRDDSY